MGHPQARHWKSLMTLTAAAILATACGGAVENDFPNPNVTYPQTNWPYPVPTSTSNPTPTQTPNTGTDPTFKASLPIMQFELNGNGGTNTIWPTTNTASSSYSANYASGFPVYTDSKLRIRISARSAGNVSLPSDSQWKYSNYQASYYCVSYVILVNGAAVGTRVLSTNGVGSMVCPYAPTNEVIDVSNLLTSGNGDPIRVQITGPRSDWYCAWLASSTSNWTNYNWWMSNYGYNWQYYLNQVYSESCSSSLRDTHRSHTVRGALEFETNVAESN